MQKKKSKVKKKTPKKFFIKREAKPVNKKNEEKELVLKIRPEWVKSALVNKTQYQKKYSSSIKNNNEFWKKEGRLGQYIFSYLFH